MKNEARMVDLVSSSYVVFVLGVVGVVAMVSAVLIAWPALAYLGAKFF